MASPVSTQRPIDRGYAPPHQCGLSAHSLRILGHVEFLCDVVGARVDLKGRIVVAATAALGLSACGAREEAAPQAIIPEQEAEPTVVTAPAPPANLGRGEVAPAEIVAEEAAPTMDPSPNLAPIPDRRRQPARDPSPVTGGGPGHGGDPAMCGASCGSGCAGDADEESGD